MSELDWQYLDEMALRGHPLELADKAWEEITRLREQLRIANLRAGIEADWYEGLRTEVEETQRRADQEDAEAAEQMAQGLHRLGVWVDEKTAQIIRDIKDEFGWDTTDAVARMAEVFLHFNVMRSVLNAMAPAKDGESPRGDG
jgi:hypothetical protein